MTLFNSLFKKKKLKKTFEKVSSNFLAERAKGNPSRMTICANIIKSTLGFIEYVHNAL